MCMCMCFYSRNSAKTAVIDTVLVVFSPFLMCKLTGLTMRSRIDIDRLRYSTNENGGVWSNLRMLSVYYKSHIDTNRFLIILHLIK